MRGKQPLVEAGGVVVAVQVLLIEIEVGERVGAVDDDRNAVTTRHAAPPP